MRIASGVTDQYIYFVAVDATDLNSRETGLSSFTVYRSRNGAASSVMTTPTINETDATNMPGVYELLLDEDMTIDAGDDTQEMAFHITHAGMSPVTRVIELYRPKITAGNTLDVTATGAAGIDWGNVENPTTSVDLSATDIQLCDTITTYTGNTVQTGDSFARLGAPAGASVSADVAAVKTETAAILVDTGTTLDGKIDTIDGVVDAILLDTAEIGAAGAGLTAVPWNASWDAEVQSECNDALVALGLDHLVSASVVGADVTDNSIIAYLASKSATADWDSYVNTTDALEAIADASGGGATNPNMILESEITTVNSQTEFVLTSGSTDNDAYNDQTIVIYDDSSSDVNLSVRVVSDYVGSTKTLTIDSAADFTVGTDDSIRIFATAPGTSAPTAAQVADAVWDEATAGHTTASTFGAQCATDIDAILVDTNELQTDWADGGRLDTILDAVSTQASVDIVDANVDSILVDTNELQTDITDGGRVDLIIERIGYSGAIWLDTNASNTNTTLGVDGTEQNPVSTIAAAMTLLTSSGYSRINLVGISSITMSAAFNNKVLYSDSRSEVDINGQDVGGSTLYGCKVTGTPAGGTVDIVYVDCDLNVTMNNSTVARNCGITAVTFSGGDPSDYAFFDCYSLVAGNSAPTITWPANANQDAVFRGYKGGLQFENMGAAAGHACSIDGDGQFIEGTCSGGAVTIRGNMSTSGVTNITVTDPARYDLGQIRTAVGLASANLDTQLSTIDTVVDTIVVDTAELQGDWTDGGRLDLILDSILVDTGTTLDSKINTIDTVVDGIKVVTDALPDSGALTSIAQASALATVDTNVDSILVDTTQIKADLPSQITKNTALANFPFFMVDATDLSTPETGLTVTAQRSIDGAAFALCANSVVEVSNGWYKINLAAADLNGDTVALRFTASGAATRNVTIVTQP